MGAFDEVDEVVGDGVVCRDGGEIKIGEEGAEGSGSGPWILASTQA